MASWIRKSLWRRLHLTLARTSDKIFRDMFASLMSPRPSGAFPENILGLLLYLSGFYVCLLRGLKKKKKEGRKKEILNAKYKCQGTKCSQLRK